MDEITLKLCAVIGLMLLLMAVIVIVGLIMRWITNEDEFILPWIVTSLCYAATLAIILVF